MKNKVLLTLVLGVLGGQLVASESVLGGESGTPSIDLAASVAENVVENVAANVAENVAAESPLANVSKFGEVKSKVAKGAMALSNFAYPTKLANMVSKHAQEHPLTTVAVIAICAIVAEQGAVWAYGQFADDEDDGEFTF